MRSSRSELIVPIRDRRQHRRILTLKNFAWAMAIAIAAFAGITIEANLRRSKGDAGYGSLYRGQLPEPAPVKTPEIITESPVPESAGADPTLVGASAREQLLRADSNVPTNTVQASSVPVVEASTAAVPGDSHVAVVGDSAGVTIVKDPRKAPVLRGGFGRDN